MNKTTIAAENDNREFPTALAETRDKCQKKRFIFIPIVIAGYGCFHFLAFDGFSFSLSYTLRFSRVSAKKRVIPSLPAHHGNPVGVKGKKICLRVRDL